MKKSKRYRRPWGTQKPGLPEFRIELDQQIMEFYGINTADANAVVEMAIGGKAAIQLYEGERKSDVRLRYQRAF
ncbi:MAG: efflux RND transporter permease subunit, partial [Ferruginibacter sp.]|nr:efflux RND transporter permease subunit [Ferruginibacter sp.]